MNIQEALPDWNSLICNRYELGEGFHARGI